MTPPTRPESEPPPNGARAAHDEVGGDKPSLLYRHDLGVVIAALALLAAGSLAYNAAVSPAHTTISLDGLEFAVPSGWTMPIDVGPTPTRFLPATDSLTPAPGTIGDEVDAGPTTGLDAGLAAPAGAAPLHRLYTYSHDSTIRLEVRIDARPALNNLRPVLAFARGHRYGELYRSLDQSRITVHEHDWLRTRFEYAYEPHKMASPRIATGVELATTSGDQLYVVTLHGNPADVAWLEEYVRPSLTVPGDPASAGMLPPPTELREHAPAVAAILPATVLIMAVDARGDAIVPVATGSGTIITPDGSILTNHHVIYDAERKRLHDVFVVGRLRASDGTTELVCAGHPERSKLEPELDLALIKCDMDMDGRRWAARDWPTAKINMNETAVLGERIWIAGYPDTNTGMVSIATGEVSGSTREGDEIDYIKTTATITHGNSGGAAIDETGLFIGVPTAYRLRTRFDGLRASDAGQVGLIRPIQRARHLIDIAKRGWQPNGDNTPAPPVPNDRGVQISSVIRDAANDRPVADAMITVFKAGIKADDVDLNKLHEQALTWANTNSEGSFTLRERVPRDASYTVAITARGYRPLVESDILILDANSPEYFDPWGYVRLER